MWARSTGPVRRSPGRWTPRAGGGRDRPAAHDGFPRHAATICVLWAPPSGCGCCAPANRPAGGGPSPQSAGAVPAGVVADADRRGVRSSRRTPCRQRSWPSPRRGGAADPIRTDQLAGAGARSRRGLLPSLALVRVTPDGQPWRRLLLGAAAWGAVLVGRPAAGRRPWCWAPSLSSRSRSTSWPGWVCCPVDFLALGGLALIGLAATYERRRRDLPACARWSAGWAEVGRALP